MKRRTAITSLLYAGVFTDLSDRQRRGGNTHALDYFVDYARTQTDYLLT